jgi:hypothetical protein
LAALGLKAPSFINRLASAGDTLAAIVPSFMLPKQVNQLLRDGRPDMSPPPEEAAKGKPLLSNIPSGRPSSGSQGSTPAGGAGGAVPNLRGDSSQLWSQADAAEDDAMSDAEFARFLLESEREYQREMEFKLKHPSGASSSRPSSAGSPGVPSAASAAAAAPSACSPMGLHPLPLPSLIDAVAVSTQGSDSSPPPLSDLELQARLEVALAEIQLGDDVSRAEREQLEQVLRISILANATAEKEKEKEKGKEQAGK